MPLGIQIRRTARAGVQITPGAQGQVLAALNLSGQLVADASVAPATSPATDQLMVQIDATPRVFLWWWRTGGAWRGVELTA